MNSKNIIDLINYYSNNDVMNMLIDKFFVYYDKTNSGTIKVEYFVDLILQIYDSVNFTNIKLEKNYQWVIDLLNKKLTDRLTKNECRYLYQHLARDVIDHLNNVLKETKDLFDYDNPY